MDRFPYSPASAFPGADSHVEPHGPAHGSDHNSNGTSFVGPRTDCDSHNSQDPESF